MKRNENGIMMQDIRMSFKDKEVLSDVSLNVEQGEIFGLLGPSGAGKTTLIKIITGQLRQTHGTAVVLGTDAAKMERSMYTQFGMMLDDSGIYERLSCYDNLLLFAQLYRIPKRRISEVLEQVSLKDAAKRTVSNLSKGMKQRLVLGRAILNAPKILFLDEPTSGLDPATAAKIHELIRGEQKRGATIFLTTHNMAEAEKLCGHVALLHEGRIVEYGSPRELCTRHNHCGTIDVRKKDGSRLTLENSASSADEIGSLFRTGDVESIHSLEPNLETVFMELTGKRLEEYEYV